MFRISSLLGLEVALSFSKRCPLLLYSCDSWQDMICFSCATLHPKPRDGMCTPKGMHSTQSLDGSENGIPQMISLPKWRGIATGFHCKQALEFCISAHFSRHRWHGGLQERERYEKYCGQPSVSFRGMMNDYNLCKAGVRRTVFFEITVEEGRRLSKRDRNVPR